MTHKEWKEVVKSIPQETKKRLSAFSLHDKEDFVHKFVKVFWEQYEINLSKGKIKIV